MLIMRPCLSFCQYVHASDRMGRMAKQLFRIADVAHLGGVARRKALTPEQRSMIARNASLAKHRRLTKQQRSEAARQAVLARWKQYRAAKKKGAAP
jgi:hypothetical protein